MCVGAGVTQLSSRCADNASIHVRGGGRAESDGEDEREYNIPRLNRV